MVMKVYKLVNTDSPYVQRYMYNKSIQASTTLLGALLIAKTIMVNIPKQTRINILFTDGEHMYEGLIIKNKDKRWYYHGQVNIIT